MTPPTPRKAPSVTLCAHPPERRRRSVIVASPSCCCCCCCCLHSAGGLVGAGIGSVSPGRSFAVSVYWIVLGVLNVLALLAGPVYALVNQSSGEDPEAAIGQGFGGALCLLIMLLPAVQLAASVVALLVVAVAPRRSVGDDRAGQLLAIVKITVGMIAGGTLGFGAMWLVYIALTSFQAK